MSTDQSLEALGRSLLSRIHNDLEHRRGFDAIYDSLDDGVLHEIREEHLSIIAGVIQTAIETEQETCAQFVENWTVSPGGLVTNEKEIVPAKLPSAKRRIIAQAIRDGAHRD